ncbi:MAG: DMT family transporter [Candidatus Hermodarchaeota archaeon]|nr:DMT family transporter [Candidatus Hermodarchaeota archaeon]
MAVPPELFLAGVFMGITAAALFGISNVVYKSQSAEIQPTAINAFKMWIALPVIFVTVFLLLYPTGFNVPLTSIPFLAGSIIFGAGLGDLMYLTSQSRIGVSRAFPIAMIFPLVTYLFSIIFLGEALRIIRLAGALLAVVGVSLITREQAKQEAASQSLESEVQKSWDKIGIALAVLAAFCWATATVILQIGLIGVDPIDANLIRITVGSLFLLPIFLIARKRGMPKPTKRASKIVLVAGFFGMGIGSLLYVSTVAITGAAVTSVVAASAPLFALPLAIFYLKEKITPLILLGTLFTVLGIWLVILGF